MRKWEQSAGNGGSILALKSMERVNWSPKQRVPVAPQNGDLSPQKNFKKDFRYECKTKLFKYFGLPYLFE